MYSSSISANSALRDCKPKLYCPMVCSVFLLMLSACSTQPFIGSTAPAEPLAKNSTVEVAVREPVISPYLRGREPVPREAQKLFDKSRAALEQGNEDAAVEQLHLLVVSYPQLSGPSLNLALLYQQRGENENAQYWFKQSITRNSNNLLAYNQYAIFLREQGHFTQSEQIYLRALEVWEPYPDTHRNLGILYDLYRGDKKNALQHFYRYQELLETQDRVVAGWIADLERQLTTVAGSN